MICLAVYRNQLVFFLPFNHFWNFAKLYQKDFVNPAVNNPLTDWVRAGLRMMPRSSVSQIMSWFTQEGMDVGRTVQYDFPHPLLRSNLFPEFDITRYFPSRQSRFQLLYPILLDICIDK